MKYNEMQCYIDTEGKVKPERLLTLPHPLHPEHFPAMPIEHITTKGLVVTLHIRGGYVVSNVEKDEPITVWVQREDAIPDMNRAIIAALLRRVVKALEKIIVKVQGNT